MFIISLFLYLQLAYLGGADILKPCRIPLIYSELGCTPIQRPGAHCPEGFNCPNRTSSNQNECHFRGKNFTIGQNITKADGLSCSLDACTCFKTRKTAAFVCTKSSCPPKDNGCIHHHESHSCCSTRSTCGEKNINKLLTCSFKNQTYYEGQKIQEPFEPCTRCICDKKFNDPSIPPSHKTCSIHYCGVKLKQHHRHRHHHHHHRKMPDYCAPVYYGDDICCPIDWICYKRFFSVENFNLVSFQNLSSENAGPKCHIGPLTLNRFDILNVNNNCIKCSCQYPPLVTCHRKKHCAPYKFKLPVNLLTTVNPFNPVNPVNGTTNFT